LSRDKAPGQMKSQPIYMVLLGRRWKNYHELF
jgi:hypothetical protein